MLVVRLLETDANRSAGIEKARHDKSLGGRCDFALLK